MPEADAALEPRLRGVDRAAFAGLEEALREARRTGDRRSPFAIVADAAASNGRLPDFASVNCPTAATLPYARQRCMNDRPGQVGTTVRGHGKRTDG